MTRFLSFASVAFAVLIGLASPASAAVLSFSANGSTNPLTLNVGGTAQIDVLLSGLGTNESLSYLATDITFDDTVVAGSDIVEGTIIPDPTGFFGQTAFGVGGAYDCMFGVLPAITSDGIFFSFTVTALAAGTGEFRFSFPLAYNSDFSSSPIGEEVQLDTSATLAFTVTESTNAVVPEPGTLFLGSIGAAISLAVRRIQTKRRHST